MHGPDLTDGSSRKELPAARGQARRSGSGSSGLLPKTFKTPRQSSPLNNTVHVYGGSSGGPEKDYRKSPQG